MIKDDSISPEPPAYSKPPAMSSIFQSVLDAFKLNRFTPNFKHNFLKAYADHPKNHQGHIPIMIKDTSPSQERPASSKPPVMSSIFESVIDSAVEKLYLPGHIYFQGCTCLPILCIIFQNFEIATFIVGIFGKNSILYLFRKVSQPGKGDSQETWKFL